MKGEDLENQFDSYDLAFFLKFTFADTKKFASPDLSHCIGKK